MRAFDAGKFSNTLGYYARYFTAQAFEKLAEAEYKLASDQAKGMGRAVTMLKITSAKYEEAKPFATIIGGAYNANFVKKYDDLIALRTKAIEENNTIYYEEEADVAAVPKPEP